MATWTLEIVRVLGETVVNLQVPDALTPDEARALAAELANI